MSFYQKKEERKALYELILLKEEGKGGQKGFWGNIQGNT